MKNCFQTTTLWLLKLWEWLYYKRFYTSTSSKSTGLVKALKRLSWDRRFVTSRRKRRSSRRVSSSCSSNFLLSSLVSWRGGGGGATGSTSEARSAVKRGEWTAVIVLCVKAKIRVNLNESVLLPAFFFEDGAFAAWLRIRSSKKFHLSCRVGTRTWKTSPYSTRNNSCTWKRKGATLMKWHHYCTKINIKVVDSHILFF